MREVSDLVDLGRVLANIGVAVFPGLQESIDAKDYVNGLKWAGIIERCVANAIKSLE